jgi:hypothetical protein
MVYWGSMLSDKIQRANLLDGSSVEDVVTGVVDPTLISLDLKAGKGCTSPRA